MENIKIDVTGNIARVTEKPIRITSGTVGLPVKFVFDNQWNGLSKTAVFRAGCVQKIRESLEDETTVPWEVLRKPGVWLSIGVYGVDASGTVVIPTIWANVCSIQVGASPDGDPGIDPTLPVWQRLLGEVGNLSLLRTTKKEDLVAAINEAYGEGEASHIEGINNQAIGIASHVEGKDNIAGAKGFHVLSSEFLSVVDPATNTCVYSLLIDDANLEDKAVDVYSVGDQVQWDAKQHHYGKVYIYELTTSAEGSVLTIVADGSLNMELDADPAENYIYVVGKNFGEVLPANVSIHVEGLDNIATGKAAHTEGYKNKSIGNYSHTEGRENTAHYCAHAEGIGTEARGDYSHSEGILSKALEYGAHAEGLYTQAKARGSHTEGIATTAIDEGQHAGGKYNLPVHGPWVIGNGNENGHSNAAQMDWDGNVRFDGDVIAFGCNGKAGISLQSLHGLVGKTSVGSQIQKALDAPLEKLYASDEAELEAALSGLMGQMADGSVKSFEVLPKRVVSEDFSDVVNEGTAITAIPTVVGDSFVKWNGAAMSPNWNAWVSSGSVIVQPHIEDGNVCMKLTPRDTGILQMVYYVPSEVYESLVDGRTYRVSARYKGEGCNFNAQMEAKASATWPVVPVGLIDGEWVTAEHEFTVDKSHGSLSLTFGIAWPGGSQGSMYLDDICLVEVITEKPFDGKSTIGQLYRANNNNAVARFATYDSAGRYMYDKILYGGAWQPLEWENPPYGWGKVYRTTERFAGYPVYAVNVACGMAVHGETVVTVTNGIADDPDFGLGYEWSIVGYEGGVVYDAVYNGMGEHDMLAKMGEYPIWYAIKGIKATWSNAGLILTFEPTGNHSMNTMEGNMFVTVKFIKKEYL